MHQSVQKLISYADSQKKTVLYEILYGINLLYYSYIKFCVSHFAHLHEIKTYISVGGSDIVSIKVAYIQTFY